MNEMKSFYNSILSKENRWINHRHAWMSFQVQIHRLSLFKFRVDRVSSWLIEFFCIVSFQWIEGLFRSDINVFTNAAGFENIVPLLYFTMTLSSASFDLLEQLVERLLGHNVIVCDEIERYWNERKSNWLLWMQIDHATITRVSLQSAASLAKFKAMSTDEHHIEVRWQRLVALWLRPVLK